MNTAEPRTELLRAIGLHRQGRREEAEAVFRGLLQKHQNDALALSELGNVAANAGLLDYAIPSQQLAASIAPRNPTVLHNLANAAALLPRYDVAIDALERAVSVSPNTQPAWFDLGRILNNSGNPDRALEIAFHHKEKQPDHIGARMNIVRSMAQLGRFADAETEALQIVDRWPNEAGGYVAIAHVKKFSAGDPLIAGAKRVAIGGRTTGLELRDLYFALGKMYDDIDSIDEAFTAFTLANKNDPTRYDRAALESRYQAIKAAYSRELLTARRGRGFASAKPVLIVGMPRSGTTLVESLLAAHPLVASIGEGHFLRSLGQTVSDFTRTEERDLVSTLHALSAEAVEFLGHRYVQAAERLVGDKSKTRIVDKLPHNFTYLGLAAMTLPQAKVVHVRRSPMAVALSCWMQNFNQAHEYSGTFEDIAHQYAQYKSLMEHWQDAIGGQIADVDYEKVVAAPDDEARAMLGSIGLSAEGYAASDARRLRVVTTASVWQVRQPVYQGAVERWRVYEHHLTPLKRAFESYGIDPV